MVVDIFPFKTNIDSSLSTCRLYDQPSTRLYDEPSTRLLLEYIDRITVFHVQLRWCVRLVDRLSIESESH
jgi:hypothetical protein